MVRHSASEQHLRTTFIFLAACILFTVTAGWGFISSRNLSNLFRQATVLGIASIGLQFVVVSGNVDITIGVLTGFSSIFASALQTVILRVLPGVAATVITILIVVVVTALIGTVQGLLVGRLKLPAIVISLGMSLLLFGLIPLATLGVFLSDVDDSLIFLGQGYLGKWTGTVLAASAISIYGLRLRRDIRGRRLYRLTIPSPAKTIYKISIFAAILIAFKIYVADGYQGLPVPVLILAVLTLFYSHLMNGTRFGNRCQAIGFSRSVARFSGIRVNLCVVGTYVISATAAGLAGIVLTGYTSFGVFGNSMGLSFSALAACLIGLVGFNSEQHAVAGAAFGALLLAGVDNWMVLIDLRPWAQEFIRGLLLLIIAFFAVRSRTGPKVFKELTKTR